MNSYEYLILRNHNLLQRYLHQKVLPPDRQYVYALVHAYPKEFWTILQSFQKTNEEKWAIVKSYFSRKTFSSICIAGKRSGKSELHYVLSKEVMQPRGITTGYYMIPNERLPPWCEERFSIAQIQANEWTILDEGAILFNPRKTMDADVSFIDCLPILAHMEGKSSVITQLSAMLDLNFFRTCDFRLVGRLSEDQLKFDREGFLSPLDRYMLPQEVGEFFFSSSEHSFVFRVPHDPSYEQYSKMYRPLTGDTRLARKYMDAFYYDLDKKPKEIQKFLAFMRYECTLLDVKRHLGIK
jgi:hypothetical protein